MDDYSRHYAVLKVTDGTEWEAVRARYRRLIGRWHPDRFPADASERGVAEEQSKQITTAYQALEQYYRKYGVLPPMGPAKGPEVVAPTRDVGTASRPTERAPEPAAPRTTGHQPMKGRPRAVIVVSALLLATYAAFRYADYDAGEPEPTRIPPPAAEIAASTAPAAGTSDRPGGITAGSTLGEVYAIQGIPTATQGDVWYYGKSSVRFVQGKVVSWTQHPDNPLRIARDQPVELREGVFSIGSSKDDVRAVQGTPVSETENVWDYGTSRVYFENNRVVGWKASPLQPLHVPH